MNLTDLLYKVSIIKVIGKINIDISDIYFNSNQVDKYSLFVALKGVVHDGHVYINDAIKNGATAIICEELPLDLNDSVTYIKVDSSHRALAISASNFFANPSKKIKLVGVTGTNGKTTIVNLLYQLFSSLGIKVGMLSTIENRVLDMVIPSTHTTPNPLEINLLLGKMVDQGCEYCFMEVSSHAIAQNRIHGLNFSGGIFTNITHDHLDYHKTFSNYINVKKIFFDSLSDEAFALINNDDKNANKMLEKTKARIYTYSLQSMSIYKCKILERQFQGTLLNINQIDIWIKLIGDFNVYNILAVYAVANLFGYNDDKVLSAISMLNPVDGRFQFLHSKDQIIGIVDYAHTDDALRNIISSINKIRTNTEKLITVVGCGGDRDKQKRPAMASVVCDLSSQVIITSDNPRSENPDSIINDMIKNLDPIQKDKVLVISDRRQAIRTACKIANSNDIVLVAGKGHEKYQEVKGKKIPFDDLLELKKSLKIIS